MGNEKNEVKRGGNSANGFNVIFRGGVLAGALITGFVSLTLRESTMENRYNVQGASENLVYDVNGDGLDDIVNDEGLVSVQQKDGSYISLRRYVENVSDSYKLQECEDGLYRTVGSGYVSGIEKYLEGDGE